MYFHQLRSVALKQRIPKCRYPYLKLCYALSDMDGDSIEQCDLVRSLDLAGCVISKTRVTHATASCRRFFSGFFSPDWGSCPAASCFFFFFVLLLQCFCSRVAIAAKRCSCHTSSSDAAGDALVTDGSAPLTDDTHPPVWVQAGVLIFSLSRLL